MSDTTTITATTTTLDPSVANSTADASVDSAELVSYRFRRWLFVAGTTGLCITLTALLAWFKTGSIAEHAVDGFTGIAETIVVTYLGASVLDRSNILQSMGDRFRTGPIGNVLGSHPDGDK